MADRGLSRLNWPSSLVSVPALLTTVGSSAEQVEGLGSRMLDMGSADTMTSPGLIQTASYWRAICLYWLMARVSSFSSLSATRSSQPNRLANSSPAQQSRTCSTSPSIPLQALRPDHEQGKMSMASWLRTLSTSAKDQARRKRRYAPKSTAALARSAMSPDLTQSATLLQTARRLSTDRQKLSVWSNASGPKALPSAEAE
mmetsp:Transcript_46620/g.99551  ORF Transcript_46620/g.99551 Transcript_46620/m.99551 type:complete len:200 (+) Transcript_46620:946-1545(+)